MGDDEDIVTGDGEVEFKDVGPCLDGVFKGGKSVFGAHGSRSAMSMDLNGLCGERHGGEDSRQTQYHAHRIANQQLPATTV